MVIIRLLANKIQTNWDSGVIQHMLKRRRKGRTWLPYGDLITKNLMYVRFNLEMKESIDNCSKISKHTLSEMKIKD